MANNKVQLADGTVLMDVTDTTALASTVKSGDIFYNAAGIRQTGTLIVDETYSIQQNLTNVTSSVDDTKVIAGNCFYTKLTPSEGYNILSVIVTMDGVDITREVFKEEFETYNIIQNLTNVESSCDDVKTMADTSFFANLTPFNGGIIEYIKVTMGGEDITEQAFKPGLGEKTIIQNGTYNASSDNASGYSRVVVNVPNTYSASDEGKVVSSGALVSQTSDTVTSNATYDTTLINSLTVNVSGGTEVTSYVVDKAGSGSNTIALDIPFTPSAIIYFELEPLTAGAFVSTTHRVMGIYVSDYPRQFFANQGNTTRGGYLSVTGATTHSYSNGVFTVGSSTVVLLASRTYRFIAVK